MIPSARTSIRLPSPAVLDSPTYFGNANTNWIKTVTRTAVSQNVGLSVSGGGHASKYFTSLAYNNIPGVVDGTDYRRISGKFNLETQIGSKFQVAVNLLLGYTDQNIGDGAYTQALLARPDMPVRDATGNYTESTDPIASPPGYYQSSRLVDRHQQWEDDNPPGLSFRYLFDCTRAQIEKHCFTKHARL